MNSLRGSGIERKAGRRGAKKASLFKENQVLIGTENTKKPHRRKKSDRHVAVESPEFQLLVKLYVPANLLIKNNQVSVKQLTAYLPELVDGRFPELNFELHIFLGSLVNTYVSSWYQKLNTENMAFVYDVYETLCAFVKDVSSRISGIADSPKLLDLVNQIAQILDTHVRDNSVDNGRPRYASAIEHRSLYTICEETDLEGLRKQYLRENHIMFDSQWLLQNTDSGFGGDVSTLTSVKAGKTKNESSPGSVYLKVLVKHILKTAFPEGENMTVQGPRSSAIVTNFLAVLLADLVLGKIIAKLSTPDFLISTVFGGISTRLKHKQESNTSQNSEAEMKPLYLRFQDLKACCEKVFKNAISASTAFRNYLWRAENGPTIFFSPVMSLVDAITGFSTRKPVLVKSMKLARSILFSMGEFGSKLDNFIGAYFLEQTKISGLADDLTLAHVIEMLRCSLFDKTSDVGSGPTQQPKSVVEVRDDIFEMLSSQLSKSPVDLSWFEFKGENDEDMKNGIENLLRIFDSEIGEESAIGPSEKKSDMNLLLVVKILDCLVQNIYPEMTTGLSRVA